MSTIVSLHELKEQQRMIGVQIRLPKKYREQARQLADAQSTPERKLTETDVYRTAILTFLDAIST